MNDGFAVLSVLRLSDGNAAVHLTPLVRSRQVGQLHVLRESALDRWQETGKVEWHVTGPRRRWPPLVKALGMGIAAARRVDVVQGFSLVPYGLLAFLFARLRGKPLILSLLGTDFNVHCHAWYGAVCRAVLRRADAVTVTGGSMLERLAEWGVRRQRLHVLPHAIEVDRFSTTRSPSERGTDLLFVGRLVRGKRVDLVLHALARVRVRRPGTTLAIVGDGPERESLERLAARLGLAEAVTFAGHRSDVERWYADARVFVMASEREGLPLVLIEAMSSGCVPVTTSCGTIADLVQNGSNGFLVEMGDWVRMGDLVLEVLTDNAGLEQLSRAARDIRTSFTWESAERVWDRLLESVT